MEKETDTLRNQLDEESESKNEAVRQVSKANAEIQQWRAKFESEGMQKANELEEAKWEKMELWQVERIKLKKKKLKEKITSETAGTTWAAGTGKHQNRFDW